MQATGGCVRRVGECGRGRRASQSQHNALAGGRDLGHDHHPSQISTAADGQNFGRFLKVSCIPGNLGIRVLFCGS
jgi:hypothetical protein